MPTAPAANDATLPEDLRFEPGFVCAPLDAQIAVMREEVQRYRNANQHRTERERGQHSMHPVTYAAGMQKRRSVLHTLLQLKAQQEHPA